MEKKLVITLNMFGPCQVFDTEKESNIFSANVNDLITPTLEYCKFKDFNKILLFGDGKYAEGIKETLLAQATTQYGLTDLVIEVN